LRSEPKKFKRTLEFGQFDPVEEGGKETALTGLGVKVFINGVNDITIREGEFKNGKLEGFGRRLELFSGRGAVHVEMGWWKGDELDGYAYTI